MRFKKGSKYNIVTFLLIFSLVFSSLGYIFAEADEAIPHNQVENSSSGDLEVVDTVTESAITDGISEEELGLPSGDMPDELIKNGARDVADKSSLVTITNKTIYQGSKVLQETDSIDLTKSFSINMTLSLPFDVAGGNDKFGLGDIAKITIGKGIVISNAVRSEDRIIQLKLNGTNTSIGTIEFKDEDNGVVAYIKFDGRREDVGDKILGDINIGMEFSVKTNTPSVTTIKLFEKTWNIKDSDSGASLTKKGEVNYQQHRIDWTINVSDKNSLANFKVIDDLSQIGDLTPNTFKVVDGNGNAINNGIALNTTKYLNYTFPNSNAVKVATITFSTDLDWADYNNDDANGRKKTNKAVLLNTESKSVAEDSSEVTVFGKWGKKAGWLMDKSSYTDTSYDFDNYYYIRWEVILNGTYDKDGQRVSKGIKDAVIVDELPTDVFGKNKLTWVSAKFSVWNGNKWTDSSSYNIASEPTNGEYKLSSIGLGGKLNTDVKLTIISKIEKSKIPAHIKYINTARGKWGGKVWTAFDASVELNTGRQVLHKNPLNTFKINGLPDNRDYVGNEVEWEITVDDDIIKDDVETYFYDVFLTHPAMDYNILKNKYDENKFSIKKEGTNTQAILESGIDILDVLPTSPKQSAYLNNFSSVEPLVTKTYDLYYNNNGTVEKAGKVLEVKGFKKENATTGADNKKVHKFRFKSKVLHVGLLTESKGDGQTVNMGYLVQKPKNSASQAYRVAMAENWPYYLSKMLHKTAIPKENADKILTGSYSIDDVNQNPNLEEYDKNNKALINVFSDKSRSILYRLSVNAAGINNLDGYLDMNLIDNLPQGWEVDKVNERHKYLIYRGERVADGTNEEYVRAIGEPLDEAAIKRLSNETNASPKIESETSTHPRRLVFNLSNIDSPYVVLLRLKKTYNPTNMEEMAGLVENKARFSIKLKGGYAHSADRTVIAAYDARVIAKNKLSKDLNKNSNFVKWSIEYRPEFIPDTLKTEITNADTIELADTLGAGLEFILDEENKLFFDGDYYVLTEIDGTTKKIYTTKRDLKDRITYDSTTRTLSLVIPKADRNKTYKLEYRTRILNNLTATNSLSLKIRNVKKLSLKEMDIGLSAWASINWSNISYAKVRVFKTDENSKPLKGAKFKIKGDNFEQRVESGENGYVEITGLSTGRYTIKEEEQLKIDGKSYALPAKNEFSFEIKKLTSGFAIIRVDSTDNADMRLDTDEESEIGSKIHIINRLNTPPAPPSTPPTAPPSEPTYPPVIPPSNPATPPSQPEKPITPPTTPEKPITPFVTPEIPVTPTDNPNEPPVIPSEDIPSYPMDSFPNPNDPDSPDEFIAVDENGTPLGRYVKKKKPDGTNEYVLVDEDETPQGVKPQKPALPKTGGSNNSLYYILSAVSLFMAMILFFRRKK